MVVLRGVDDQFLLKLGQVIGGIVQIVVSQMKLQDLGLPSGQLGHVAIPHH